MTAPWQQCPGPEPIFRRLFCRFHLKLIPKLLPQWFSQELRVSFLKMRCFPPIWDAIFAFIGFFGEVSLATEIILAVGEVAFIYNLNIWTVFFCFVWLVQGYLASYFGPELQKYTSFKVHHEEIRHVTANDHGILSLSCNELCFSSRPGLRIFRLR